MSLRSVPGQEHVAEAFERVFKNDRLGHAYVFAGPKGVGKSLFARELAKALLCPKKPLLACDECPTCRRVDSGSHPDVHWYRPPEGKRVFPIDTVRLEIIPTMGIKSFEGGYKVFIIEPAEMMSEDAANCLLKTLEEPPEMALLILVTSAPNRLLPTILSRCQRIRFRAIPRAALAQHLKGLLQIGEDKARDLAHLSGGSLAAALAIHQSDGIAFKNKVIDRVIHATAADYFAVAEELIASAPSKSTLDEKREHLCAVLNSLASYYRDMLACAGGGEIIHRDRAEDLSEHGRKIGPDRVEKIVQAIFRTQESLLLNVNLDLALGNLMVEIVELQR